MIQKLNKDIDDEYIRLAQQQTRSVEVKRDESWVSRWLGMKALRSSKTEKVHSSTAFVEFHSLVAKEQAIQCNVTGLSRFLEVQKVPEIRQVVWDNFHIALAVIDARRFWANVILMGALIAWSFLVAAIRSVNDASQLLGLGHNHLLAIVLDVYLPALLVEMIVRIIPKAMIPICRWIRFKSLSEIDHFILKWVSRRGQISTDRKCALFGSLTSFCDSILASEQLHLSLSSSAGRWSSLGINSLMTLCT